MDRIKTLLLVEKRKVLVVTVTVQRSAARSILLHRLPSDSAPSKKGYNYIFTFSQNSLI